MKQLLIVLFVVFSPALFAQELLMPDLPEMDSLELVPGQEFPKGQLLPDALIMPDIQSLQVPDFDFNAALPERWSFNVAEELFSPGLGSLFMNGSQDMLIMPFLHSGSVFSSAAYKVNDRFAVGGFSYGANSVFTAPLPGKGINSYDFRGSTLFMKYEV